MGGILTAQTQTVIARNNFGQFISACEAAAHNTAEDTMKLGVRTAKRLAPVGGENKASYSQRPGYRPLRSSIEGRALGNRGEWTVSAPHWKYVEYPTGAHPIHGYLHFYWKGGEFVWNNPAYGNWDATGATVDHPGTEAQPFMRPSYRIASARMMAIARRHYPG